MASDSQWSGLLIVVIFVAIFAITSVSAMAIYFFCKCHKKKQKGMQVRPAPRIADEESEDDESGNLFLRREPRDEGLHWITTSDSGDYGRSIYQSPRRLDTPNVSGISETYMAPQKKKRERGPNYLAIRERRDAEERETNLSEAIESVRKANRRNLPSRRDEFEREAYLNMISNRRSVESTPKPSVLVSLDENLEENYDNNRGDYISPRRIFVDKANKKRNSTDKMQVTGIADNYNTTQILRIEPDSGIEDVETLAGIYRKPQRVKVRDSISRGSGTRSMSPNYDRHEQQEVLQEGFSGGRPKPKRKGASKAKGQRNDSSSYMFTATSKTAWMFDT